MSILFRDPASRDAVRAEFERFRARCVPHEARTVSTRLGETHLLVAGPQDAPPVVIFHGALASSAHLLGEVGRLTERYRVYAIDVIGQSVMSADVRVDLDGPAYGEWAVDVLDALGLARPHVWGVSWGGFVARKLAEHAPERVDRLVLLVPAGIVAGPAWRGFTEMGWPLMTYRMFPSEARLARLARGLLTTLDPDWIQTLGVAFKAYTLDMRIPPLARPEALAAFDRPTLVLGAELDVSFPGHGLAERAPALFRNVEVEVLVGERHSPATDEAGRARMCGRVARFLEEGERSATSAA